MLTWVLTLSLAIITSRAEAHTTSDYQLNLSVGGTALQGTWDVMLPDLAGAVPLDADQDGRVSNEELTRSGALARDYMLAQLQVKADGQSCTLTDQAMQVGKKDTGRFLRLQLAGQCPLTPSTVQVTSRLFMDQKDTALHRGFLNLEAGGRASTSVFTPASITAEVTLARPGAWQNFLTFIWLGMTHIWAGLDHVLFLLTLLLPTVLKRQGGHWQPVGHFREALVSVIKVVTAFTVAHSVTLTLSALGILTFPSQVVESVIAASVVFAALNNLVPLVQERARWAVAFGFGLMHGFGFSSVLSELVEDRRALVQSLLGFNIGVELGQLALVAVAVPLLFWIRATVFYRRMVFAPASVGVAVVAAIWLVQRALPATT
ncbi:HupE/UreJ family protein [Deinococcus sp. HMF7620]|uniref:HupE/UreJ family protein n=1 Tax=Deinococcus arboris TaxID=2682977 RepID=A0A7C9MB60_9DEIO|nr:HupE/UreJ family protein [Deinococcus arboris]MVN88903.1 HupE/UreJ family protein [Deinococcus arboris]